MDILNIFFVSIGSVAALFLLTKITGNKQMAQMNMFDYINGITIGSIAAEMATSLENDFLKPLTAMTVYAAAVVLIDFATAKSIKLRRFFEGRAVLLYDNRKLYRQNFSRARLNINEFLTECRTKGYFNLAEIETAILESDGRISILPKAETRPLTPSDVKIAPKQEKTVTNIILDGKVLEENLKVTGNNHAWLAKEMEKQKIKHVSDIFLATCDVDNQLSIYVKLKSEPKNDKFQ